MVPMIAVALVWSKLYSPTEGPLNQMLGVVRHRAASHGCRRRTRRCVSIVLLNVWQQVGYFTVLVVAGLTQIPGSLYEAARLDGASGQRLLWRITLPLMRRTMLFSAVIALINAVQVFEPVALITQGGPVGSTNVLTYHIRRVGIERAAGRPRLGDGGDADAVADRGDRGRGRSPSSAGRTTHERRRLRRRHRRGAPRPARAACGGQRRRCSPSLMLLVTASWRRSRWCGWC